MRPSIAELKTGGGPRSAPIRILMEGKHPARSPTRESAHA